jgi:hypothetical protein
MSILDKIFKRRRGLTDLSLEELRVEEKRLEIRENQYLNQVDKLDKQREEVFNQGAKTKSPARRRIYARRFEECAQRINLHEKELSRTVKELMTLGRIRSIMERKRGGGPGGNLLQKLSEEDVGKLMGLLEDDKISEEVYVSKLDMLLGVVNDPAYESSDIGNEGMEVLKTWEKMDEGELEFDDALSEATGKEAGGGTKEKEEDEGQAEPN